MGPIYHVAADEVDDVVQETGDPHQPDFTYHILTPLLRRIPFPSVAFILSNFIYILIYNFLFSFFFHLLLNWLIYSYSDTPTISPTNFSVPHTLFPGALFFISISLSLPRLCFGEMGSLEAERKTTGWAARDPSGVLSPYEYTLR